MNKLKQLLEKRKQARAEQASIGLGKPEPIKEVVEEVVEEKVEEKKPKKKSLLDKLKGNV